MKKEIKTILIMVSIFLVCYFLPVENARFKNAIFESLHLVKWYAREHVVLCLLPAFFIAGAIAVFISQGSVMKYLGPGANKIVSYGVASVSGSILAVCSCTVLPLFAGIYKMGAGLGPAVAFLYSGPAINVLAILLTGSVLGASLSLARAIGAVLFSIIIGLLMHFIFRNEEEEKAKNAMHIDSEEEKRTLFQTAIYFFVMVGILVFTNWGKPMENSGLWFEIYSWKWVITSIFGIIFGIILNRYFSIEFWKIAGSAIIMGTLYHLYPENKILVFTTGIFALSLITAGRDDESGEWFSSSFGFAKLIMPLLFWGVLVAGFLLGRPGGEGIIPSEFVHRAVGGNGLQSNIFASIAGAFMYFATLTEVPIVEGLIRNGMGKGPALALLLAGPALSLPNMLVIKSIMGLKKTVVFVTLVIVMATISGLIYGNLI